MPLTGQLAMREASILRAAPLYGAAGMAQQEPPPAATGKVAFVTRTRDDLPPRPEAEAEAFQQPCSLKGLSSGVTAGVGGYMFGVVSSMWRNRSLKAVGTWGADGIASAQYLAVMSGVYAMVQCLCERLREADDGWNRGVAGCASGLAVGWRAGPVGAAQSCAMFAGFSVLFDFGNAPTGAGAAHAAGAGSGSGGCRSGRCSVSLGRAVGCSVAGQPPAVAATANGRQALLQLRFDPRQRRAASALEAVAEGPRALLEVPPVLWLGPLFSSSYFGAPALTLG